MHANQRLVKLMNDMQGLKLGDEHGSDGYLIRPEGWFEIDDIRLDRSYPDGYGYKLYRYVKQGYKTVRTEVVPDFDNEVKGMSWLKWKWHMVHLGCVLADLADEIEKKPKPLPPKVAVAGFDCPSCGQFWPNGMSACRCGATKVAGGHDPGKVGAIGG